MKQVVSLLYSTSLVQEVPMDNQPYVHHATNYFVMLVDLLAIRISSLFQNMRLIVS